MTYHPGWQKLRVYANGDSISELAHLDTHNLGTFWSTKINATNP